jgi:hypothetical protein
LVGGWLALAAGVSCTPPPSGDGAGWNHLSPASAEPTWETRGGKTGGGGTVSAESCLSSFTGPITELQQNFGFRTSKIATWVNQARFDARGGIWTSLLNGSDRKNTAPIQFGVDWGTNLISPSGSGRRDIYSIEFNTYPQSTSLCFHGGTVIGTQPLNATWREVKEGGGGYAITWNTSGLSTIEYMRIHNHEDAFVPYRSTSFIIQDNWVSYTRDDCIENDAFGAGVIRNNLFDSCFVFYSAVNPPVLGPDAPIGAGASGVVRVERNLIRMGNAPAHGAGSDRTKLGYGAFFKAHDRESPVRVPRMVLRDNVVAYEVPGWWRGRGAPPTSLKTGKVRVTECSNNTILWFGDGSFPGPIPDALSSCFKIVTGKAARDQWTSLRQQWIDAHPDIPRL